MRKERVVVTNEILEQGKSRNGGWSNKQMALLGVERKRNKGWKWQVIGSKVPGKNVRKFLQLKNVHLKKQERYQRFLEFKKNATWTEKAQQVLRQFGKLKHLHNLSRQEIALIMDYAKQKVFAKADFMFLERMKAKIARIGFIKEIL